MAQLEVEQIVELLENSVDLYLIKHVPMLLISHLTDETLCTRADEGPLGAQRQLHSVDDADCPPWYGEPQARRDCELRLWSRSQPNRAPGRVLWGQGLRRGACSVHQHGFVYSGISWRFDLAAQSSGDGRGFL